MISKFPLTIVGHVDNHPLGWIKSWADINFSRVDFVRSHRGELPILNHIKGPVIVMGGHEGVADIPRIDWLKKEADFIDGLLSREHPFLGICLGAQLMAHVLGHEVSSCPNKTIECGYYETHSNGTLPEKVYHWHRDGVTVNPLKNNLTCLGRASWRQGLTSHAFERAGALGVQFHPEVTKDLIEDWLGGYGDYLLEPGAKCRKSHTEDHENYGALVRHWLEKKIISAWA